MSHYCFFNDELRFILCVDPKCGSSTVKRWFNRILGEESADSGADIGRWMRPSKTVGTFSGYKKVWFVRDPFRRLVSFYYQFVVTEVGDWCFADKNKIKRLEGQTFEYFLRTLGSLHDNADQLQHHLTRQTRALLSVQFDAIVKIEELNERSEELMELLGVDLKPGHQNRQAQGQYTESSAYLLTPDELAMRPAIKYESFWNEELTAIARKIYAQDIEFYDAL